MSLDSLTPRQRAFVKRNRRKNAHLYKDGPIEGYDYVVCPILGERLVMIKSNYIVKTLEMTVDSFTSRFPNQARIAEARRARIRTGLSRVDPETGLTRHQQSVILATASRGRVGSDGLSVNQRKGRKTRATHMARVDGEGRNGYQRIAHYRNTTLTEDGISVQRAALLKRAENSGNRNGLKGASQCSRRDLAPIIDFLNCHGKKYYFDANEYGIRWENDYFYYDLVIPDIGLAIEYQGEAFHPDQHLDATAWTDWRQVFTGKTADQVHRHDTRKAKALWGARNFRVWPIYERNAEAQVSLLLSYLSQARIDPPEFVANSDWEVLSPGGWVDFSGTLRKSIRPLLTITLSDGRALSGTHDHHVYENGVLLRLDAVAIGTLIDTDSGRVGVVSIREEKESVTFDMVEVGGGHTFLANGGIHTKNCDEFAFLRSADLAQNFWTSVQPTLSTGGSCIITSTPKSDEDQFAQIWKGAIDTTDEYGNPTGLQTGRNGFYGIMVPWWEHPERDEEWAKPFRQSLGPARFAQEFECSFVNSDATLIEPMKLAEMKYHEPEFYTGTVRWFKMPESNKTYLVGLDPSVGAGGDAAAIQVFELPGMIQVAEWQHNLTVAKGQVRVLLQILHFIDGVLRDDPNQGGEPEIFWTIENNTIGEHVLQIVEDTGEERFPGMFVSERKRKGTSRRFRKGMLTTNSSKLAACARFKSLVETSRCVLNSRQTIKELKSFVGNDSGISFAAKQGEHDDLVMAALLCVRMLDTVGLWGGATNELKEHISDDELFEDSHYDEAMPVVL